MNSDEIIKGTYKPDDVTLLLKDVIIHISANSAWCLYN